MKPNTDKHTVSPMLEVSLVTNNDGSVRLSHGVAAVGPPPPAPVTVMVQEFTTASGPPLYSSGRRGASP